VPLKLDDLKTFEAYKRAVKQDLTKISAQGQTKFWVYKDVELPTASGGKQKVAALISLVDDVAAKAALKGKPPFCKGTCGLKEGKIAFEATQGKIPYGILTKSVPLLLGKLMHVPRGADLDNKVPAPPPRPPAPPMSPGGVSTPGRYARLNAAWKQLSQQANGRIAANPAEKPRLAQMMADIPKMLQGGQLGEAEKRIGLLQQVLKGPPPSAGAGPGQRGGAPYPGLVKYRSALLGFAQAKSKVQAQIHGLRNAIVARWPGEAAFAKELAKGIEELNQEVSDAVDEAMKAAENRASPATDAIKLKIRKYLTELSSNPLIQQADSNPLGAAVTIRKTLGEALGRIRDAMPA
jgi:hypothetical protein